jgi:hypothetical protein
MTGYTQSDIQRIIKEAVPKSFVFEFLDKSINESNISKFGRLLNVSEINDKYLFDLIIALLYKEVISIEQITEVIAIPRNILEKAVILEYNLYEIIGGFTATSANNNAIKYVRNHIPKLYYGLADRLSYRNEANILSELLKLYNLTDVDFDWPSGLDDAFNSASMVRINDNESYIEGENISLYSFLINYDTTNIYFIRKKKALESGVYRKIESGVEKDETLSELTSYFQYGKYATPSTDYQNAHDFLLDFYEKIKNGTINY